MKKIKTYLAFLLALAVMFSLTACGSGSTDTSDASESAQNTATSTDSGAEESDTANTGDKTFVYGADANSANFDPYAELQSKSGNFLVQAAGETLWTIDAEGEINYKLAKNLEWIDDLTMQITLQEDVQFSNGNDFTAEDVLFCIQRLAETPRTISMLACLDLEACEAVDDYTVNLVFAEYDAAFVDALGNASFMMLDKDTVEADPDFAWFVGTGPYKLQGDGDSDTSGWEESVCYTMVRNELYWGDEPYYDTLICRFFSEESTRYAELQSGSLDAAYFSEGTYINNVANGTVSGVEHVQVEKPGVYGFAMAATERTRGTMSDINIRKAFAHALDIPTMVETLGEGVYQLADSILTTSNWAYLSTGTYEYDPELAAEYLAEAGYSVDNPLTLEMVSESTAINSAIAESAQAYLSQIGINLDLSGLGDFSTILPILLASEMDVNINTASNGSGNDPASLLQQMGPLSDNVLMASTDSRLVELFNEGSASRDNSERIEIYHEFQQIFHDEYLFIPLWQESGNFAVTTAHTSFADCLDVGGNINPVLLTD